MLSADAHIAGGRLQTAGQDIHGSGFSRAVRTEEADDFTVPHAEGDIAHRAGFSIAFDKVLYLYHGSVSFCSVILDEYTIPLCTICEQTVHMQLTA